MKRAFATAIAVFACSTCFTYAVLFDRDASAFIYKRLPPGPYCQCAGTPDCTVDFTTTADPIYCQFYDDDAFAHATVQQFYVDFYLLNTGQKATVNACTDDYQSGMFLSCSNDITVGNDVDIGWWEPELCVAGACSPWMGDPTGYAWLYVHGVSGYSMPALTGMYVRN